MADRITDIVAALPGVTGDKWQARQVAALLASSRSLPELAAVFDLGSPLSGVSEELRTCLAHELALRGVHVAATPGLAGWATSAHHHPLGWLPLSLVRIENEPNLATYSATGHGCTVLSGPSGTTPVPQNSAALVPTLTETTTPATAETIAAAVDNWVNQSNGSVEARVFSASEPLVTDGVPKTLTALDLECLRGPRAPLTVSQCPPDQAWRILFDAAANGGAYNLGEHGAYGRLAAWRSLAGLSGAVPSSSFAEVEARVAACQWYHFEANTTWFHHVAWDIGFACLSPDGRRLAILAATDTD
ncbi:hypothetical protein Lfu02_28490 [Longispora fulva]|uniref:Uncharacterized protein n=1 Tax=Longispora fulva TaxID=619741 RepID=A0A8J7GLJ7_9ACTN|nr:DUF6183 family protein [Longispora fulva]MBG6138983.1 hypothetical protein [Longispora fulva]GIG58477.1 hypothetical protein Lfu02_28490 [Longispora fulva]